MPLTESSLARGFIHRLQKGEMSGEALQGSDPEESPLQAMRGSLEWLAPQLDALPSQFEEAFTHLETGGQ